MKISLTCPEGFVWIWQCPFSIDPGRSSFRFRFMFVHGRSPLFRETVFTKAFSLNLRLVSRLFVLAAFLMGGPVRAESADELYLKIFEIVDRADSLLEKGQTNSARAKYQEAQSALLDFKQANPTWNAKVVALRLSYLAGKISALSQPAAAATPVEPASSANVQVKLLEAGAEPRRALRVRAKVGDQQTLGMTVKTSMSMGMGAVPGATTKMPGISMTVGVLCQAISANGEINYELLIQEIGLVDEADSLPQVVEVMKASLNAVKGMSISCTMSDRGFRLKSDAKIPPGTDPAARQAMEQMKESFAAGEFALPEEAVGPGAKWEVKQKIKTQGMTIDQTKLCTLVSSEGDTVTVTNTIVQLAANQKISNPMMPQMKSELAKLEGSGNATMTIDLGKVVPLQATLDDHTQMALAVDVGGQKQAMTIKSDANVRLEAK